LGAFVATSSVSIWVGAVAGKSYPNGLLGNSGSIRTDVTPIRGIFVWMDVLEGALCSEDLKKALPGKKASVTL
jgi:hypothetical protein